MLIAVVRLDHPQHQHRRADAQRAPAGKIERAIALRRIVDHDHEFRRVTGLVAAALLAHRLPRPPPELSRGSRSTNWNPATALGGGTRPEHRSIFRKSLPRT